MLCHAPSRAGSWRGYLGLTSPQPPDFTIQLVGEPVAAAESPGGETTTRLKSDGLCATSSQGVAANTVADGCSLPVLSPQGV
jgi:hypothetical protein